MRDVDDVLDAVHVRREGRHEHAALDAGDQGFQAAGHVGLAGRAARTLGVGAVAEQQQHAVLPGLLDAREVAGLAVAGFLVEFEVPGVQHHAGRRGQDVPGVVGNRVGHADEFHLEVRADADLVGQPDLAQVHVAVLDAELGQFLAHQAQRQARAVHGNARQAGQDVRQAADVILVPVREDHALDQSGVLLQVIDARDDQVDAHLVAFREGQPGVHDHDLVLVAVGGDVLADLAHAAQRNDFEVWGGDRFGLVGFVLGHGYSGWPAGRAQAGCVRRRGLECGLSVDHAVVSLGPPVVPWDVVPGDGVRAR